MHPSRLLPFALLLALTAETALAQPAPLTEIRPGRLPGYLSESELPNAFALVPPAPLAGSPEQAYESDVNQRMLALRGTPRWALAIEDAELGFPAAAGTFSCALGAPISEQDTPYTYRVLRRTLLDAGLSTYSAKNHYQRTRPFVINGQPTCTPESEETLRTDGSYPSGHTAIGWAWALILTELAPDRSTELLNRGRVFGESRMVCNVHWAQDVRQGMHMGAATVALLQANAEFRADMEGAKAELAAVRANGRPPVRNCEAEAAAMAIGY